MANQQYLFAATVASLKRALARHDDVLDSDDEVAVSTNRGNKMKRKAQHIQEARLDQADSPRVYRRKLDYNGYMRNTISHNPPRVDADGDVVDEEEEDDAELTPAEDDPYADIRLEEILMPLTSAANLHMHPSLAKPYTSKSLEEMARNAESMVRQEKVSLWKAKQLLAKFRGDKIWVPCGSLESDHDIYVFGEQAREPSGLQSERPEVLREELPAANWDRLSNVQLTLDLDDATRSDESVLNSMKGNRDQEHDGAVDPSIPSTSLAGNGQTGTDRVAEDVHSQMEGMHEGPSDLSVQPDRRAADTTSKSELSQEEDSTYTGRNNVEAEIDDSVCDIDHNTADDEVSGTKENNELETSNTVETILEPSTLQTAEIAEGDEDAERPSHRMTTRARAQADTSNDPTASDTAADSPAASVPFIHPFFSVPPQSIPDKDVGLPSEEADRTRIMLMLYVHKQEELCRGITLLHEGLLKALRLRKLVFQWCKAEGHVGEMSDGEDWYDREEWGLDEDLKKGEEQEEDDGIVGPSKKTRRARAAA